MKESKQTVCGEITISGTLDRYQIVKKVVNTFIESECERKGKGVVFKYQVESLPGRQPLFISRPGHKKNFDFKVDVTEEMELGEGTHSQMASDLKEKGRENPAAFQHLLNALRLIYKCEENNVDKVLKALPKHSRTFKSGATLEVMLKVIKWLFIMEDIVYWDVEGRAFLYNYLVYVSSENDSRRLEEAFTKIKNPERLKSFMKKAGIPWTPYKD